MKLHAPLATVVAVILACGLGLSLTPQAGALDQPRKATVNPFGSEAFRHFILHEARLKALKSIDDLEKDPQKTLLIVFGNPAVLQKIDDEVGLQTFLDKGGAVFVATELGSNLLNQVLGITPTGTVLRNRLPENRFHNEEECPFVVPTDGDHPIFRGVKRIATNAPSSLYVSQDAKYKPLAHFSEGCFDDRGMWMLVPVFFFAAGNNSAPGKVLVLAGHGVFFNGNLTNPDNVTFARNCVNWFTRDDGKQIRDRVLFVEWGRIHTRLDVPLARVPDPPIPPLDLFNRLIYGVDRENLLNKVLLTSLGGNNPDRDQAMRDGKERLFVWICVVASALLILYGYWRLLRARHRRDLKVPLVAGYLASMMPTQPVVGLRDQVMLQEGNLWEAARALARECFAAYADRSMSHPPPSPRVTVQGGWTQRRALGRLVDRLWTLAYGGRPAPVTRSQLLRLSEDVDQVKVALAAGILKLHEPSPAGSPRPLRPRLRPS
jgi:hypothetical protein